MEAKIFIGSQEIESKSVIKRYNRFSNDELISPICEIEYAKKALEVANLAKKDAKNSPLHKRINWLLDVAQKLEENAEDLAQTITVEVNKPITFSRVEVKRCVEVLKITASELLALNGETINTDAMESGKKSLSFFKREPVGVVVAITPFNFPLNLVAHKLAPALGMGNCVILKPTPEAPITAYKFAKLFIESSFATKDALSVVYGDADIGNTLVSSAIPRLISFTGSVQVGNIITKNAGIKKIALELGGNAGTFIDESANLAFSSKRCAYGAFVNSGQVCISLQRIYVHKNVYEEFANLLAQETKELKVGNPFDEDTFLASLINSDALNRAKSWIESAKREGATILCGGEVIEDKNILYPTVVTNVRDDMAIVCEEVFAPIVSLISVDSVEEAISKLNSSPYGLQFSIFSDSLKNIQLAIEELECGGVVINDIPTLRFDIQPYGGVKLSGVGREGGKFALEEFSEIKSVVIL